MRIAGLSPCAFSGCAAVALLAACGGSQAPIGAPGAMPQSYSRHTDRGKSWMAPDAKAIKELLYISDGATDDVFVYDYETRALVGKLTGFDQPSSQCVEREGRRLGLELRQLLDYGICPRWDKAAPHAEDRWGMANRVLYRSDDGRSRCRSA